MPARALMLQGTGSDVGKSLLVAGLCRAYSRRGLSVLPFKPQNMSNNAAATPDGGEIGRAQALQARACGVVPDTDMNPVLLKPSSDRRSQVVVHGRVAADLAASAYQDYKAGLARAVADSFARLKSRADLVIVEGAGSPAEINLRANDIANMGFAMPHGVPVVLVGDIDRGGVIASVVGTHAVLPPDEQRLIQGFIINKFRGDPRLFDDGMAEIARRTGWPALGLVPWLGAARALPEEDAMRVGRHATADRGALVVAVPMLARIANFDDLDPLAAEPGVEVRFVPPGQPLPAEAAVIVLPGSKATIADLRFLRSQGWDIDLLAHWRRGGRVLGICGGYQMLGRIIADPEGLEGPAETVDGLGLLAIDTVLAGRKTVRPITGETPDGIAVTGYEIHLGQTEGPDCARPMLSLAGRPDGAVSADGRVAGCYLHGLFGADGFRRAWLDGLKPGAGSDLAFEARVEAALDELADHLAAHIDLDTLLALARR
ncbi:MAG: cobyric acid synthase [Alphaproteobacteria bacterium]|nr:cobyric acid synthase [Alphaproteobacteria bacterium]